MRNLVAYPVTKDEIIQALTGIQKSEEDKAGIGCMTPYLLQLAIEIVEKHGDEIVEKHKIV